MGMTKSSWTGVVVVPKTQQDSNTGKTKPLVDSNVQVNRVLFYEKGKKLFETLAWSGTDPNNWSLRGNPENSLIDGSITTTQSSRQNERESNMPVPDGVYQLGPFDPTNNQDSMGPWRIAITQRDRSLSQVYNRDGIFMHEETNQIPGTHGCLSIFDSINHKSSTPYVTSPETKKNIANYMLRNGNNVPIVLDLLPGDNNREQGYLRNVLGKQRL